MAWNSIKNVLGNIDQGQRWRDTYWNDGVNQIFPNWFHFLWGITMLIMSIFLLIFI